MKRCPGFALWIGSMLLGLFAAGSGAGHDSVLSPYDPAIYQWSSDASWRDLRNHRLYCPEKDVLIAHRDECARLMQSLRTATRPPQPWFFESPHYWAYWTAAEALQKPDDALAALRQAAQLWPEDDEVQWLLARTFASRKDSARTVEALRAALTLYEKHGAGFRKANIYHFVLAGRYEAVDQPQAAFDAYRKAVETGEELRRIRDLYANSERFPGFCGFTAYFRGEKFGKNRLFQHRQAVALLERGFEAFPDTAELHFCLGLDCRDYLKDYVRAESHLRQAYEISRRQADHYCTYAYVGDPPLARKVWEKRYPSGHVSGCEDFAKYAAVLAATYADEVEERAPSKLEDNLQKAEALLTNTLAALQDETRPVKDAGMNNYLLHETLSVLSRVRGCYPAYSKYEPELALRYAAEAQRRRSSRSSTNLYGLGLIGTIYLRHGEYDRAVLNLERFRVNEARAWWWYPDTIRARGLLAEAYDAAGQTNRAIGAIDDAVRWVRQWLHDARTDDVKLAATGQRWRAVFDEGVRVNLKAGRPGRAIEMMEMVKARAMLDLVANSPGAPRHAAIADAEKERQLLQSRITTLQVASAADSRQDLASLQRSLVLVQDRVTRLHENLENSQRAVESARNVASLTVTQIQNLAAASGATFVQYWGTGFVAVVSAQAVVVTNLPRPVTEGEIASMREAIESAGNTARGLSPEPDGHAARPAPDVLPLARDLYDRLLRPIEPWLGTNLLVIAPDQALNFLPFQMLHDGTHYLIETHPLVYAPSASVFGQCVARRRKAHGPLLAFGNPNLREPQYRLVHAQAEAEKLAALFPGSRALIGDEASEKAVQVLAPDFNILHFACHASANLDDPQTSCLRLTPDKENDGYLHVGEIFNLSLGAGLVTLSACESGVGKVTDGSEVIGLPRAFMFAGTPSFVASLCKVDDAATADLMTRFYEGLKTQDKARALQTAQRAMIAQNRSPFYWAGFCLYGDYF